MVTQKHVSLSGSSFSNMMTMIEAIYSGSCYHTTIYGYGLFRPEVKMQVTKISEYAVPLACGYPMYIDRIP